ncbi:ADP-glyceromanno-heptose 6-epimerase [Leptospira bandrabouensis]|uniref:ADP-glyceromanno-heptose 6-epimerase n=1 Tax=Leptospira bandrabouensis TaxID=2484903 RepID=UPI001EE8FEEC|nr:ADP-glyceromanno-heptose 6-epimerase [Leptospira bandrabouensis]MCG6144888.1 ADP-glyceromanno-heptose 6-epimerase [Leptospira bandrabouensis]MCG6152903.1 ADP-glyceromanno-heptose 6-epimerase [Leptospira bandrabouensis]MCG6160475.1 ADP-glyceromanno-heptose 6-epimerase [Leptospira bandrabouensis]MCG6164407.1 ADP-glyceromanno-heptose 6-epimerase [Leptospira bandrabouensis]MCW7459063.1 ADP-glyceromanno-heptose 6-epimerase [Leptospira bandrabouensis]
MAKKLTLVTGGAGLIGSQIIEDLNHNGNTDILVVDHLGTTEKWKNLQRNFFLDYYEKDKFESMLDVRHPLLNEISEIYHLGACSATTEKDATYLMQNNFHYTKKMAEFAVTKNIPFLYASSAATYGEGEYGYDDKAPIENLKPLNMYGYSKQLFDLYAKKVGIADRLVGLKYFNVFGYGEAHKGDMRSLVLKGYEQIRDTGKLKLFKSYKPEYKDGEQKRDFLYVKDASKISIYLLSERKYGLYNVGRGIAETWNDLANALFTSMNQPVNIEYVDMPESLKGKYQYYTCAEMEKINQTGYPFGYTNLRDAVGEYVSLLLKDQT